MDAGAPPFLVELDSEAGTVDAWSVTRLPFEPKGWLVELRAELRSALKSLRARNGAVLSALYGSPVAEFCDAENILIYNVGASHMAAAAARGIRIERAYDCPTPPTRLESDARHYWAYRPVPVGDEYSAWREAMTVATWFRVPMPALTETTKPAAVWHALRTARIEVGATADTTRPFGLRLVLGVPVGERMAPAKVVKPLVDGVIAALHSHDGSALDELGERLQAQLPTETADGLVDLLVDGDLAPLGRRRLVWPRATGVQWNPADDRCLALELRVERSERRELSGRLVEITAR